MMKNLWLPAALLFVAALSGCSDSTSTTPSGFVLGYSSDPVVNTSYNPPVGIFNFKVINNGAPVKGATLHYTEYRAHSTVRDTASTLSDADGLIKGVGLQIKDTTTGFVFQVTKDTLTSNSLPWQR